MITVVKKFMIALLAVSVLKHFFFINDTPTKKSALTCTLFQRSLIFQSKARSLPFGVQALLEKIH